MGTSIYDLVTTWDQGSYEGKCGKRYPALHEQLEFFQKVHYCQYVPTLDARFPDYFGRLEQWLENVSNDDEKRLLFEFAAHIMFLGRDEFLKLYQAALRGPITRWTLDTLGMSLDDSNADAILEEEVLCHTWFCPITDSMVISEFHHANNIGGVDFRPDFRSLAEFGDVSRLLNYMNQHKDASGQIKALRRIVLLEDFVGGGTQICKAAHFAASLSPDIQVLLLPLVICPAGVALAKQIESTCSNVRYTAVMELAEDLFINPSSTFPTHSLEEAIRSLAKTTYALVEGNKASSPRPYSPFGCWETGATLVMYSNAPANTLPMIQHRSNTWRPLFPRSARIR